MRRLASLLFTAVLVVACTSAPSHSPAAAPIVAEVRRDTAALVMDGQVYCAAVWVDRDKLLTADHCVKSAEDYSTLLRLLDPTAPDFEMRYLAEPNATPMHAEITKRDADHDLALLTVTNPPLHGTAPLASFEPTVGDAIHVIGHPSGLGWSYSRGYVSAFRNNLGDNGPYMQASVPIWKGNSGGGAFDSQGNLVGICSFMLKGVPNVGFFIPLTTVKRFLK